MESALLLFCFIFIAMSREAPDAGEVEEDESEDEGATDLGAPPSQKFAIVRGKIQGPTSWQMRNQWLGKQVKPQIQRMKRNLRQQERH
jgi:hypothetical protein